MTWSEVTSYLADPKQTVSMTFPMVILVSSDANCKRNHSLKATYYRSSVIHRPEFFIWFSQIKKVQFIIFLSNSKILKSFHIYVTETSARIYDSQRTFTYRLICLKRPGFLLSLVETPFFKNTSDFHSSQGFCLTTLSGKMVTEHKQLHRKSCPCSISYHVSA